MTARPAVRREPRFTAEEIFEGLWDAKIGFELRPAAMPGRVLWVLRNSFGLTVANGRAARSFDECVEAMRRAAIKHFPESNFARRFGDPA